MKILLCIISALLITSCATKNRYQWNDENGKILTENSLNQHKTSCLWDRKMAIVNSKQLTALSVSRYETHDTSKSESINAEAMAIYQSVNDCMENNGAYRKKIS